MNEILKEGIKTLIAYNNWTIPVGAALMVIPTIVGLKQKIEFSTQKAATITIGAGSVIIAGIGAFMYNVIPAKLAEKVCLGLTGAGLIAMVCQAARGHLVRKEIGYKAADAGFVATLLGGLGYVGYKTYSAWGK